MGKQGRKCLPFSGPHPFPSYYTDAIKPTHATHTYTHTHTHTKIIKCPTHNIAETFFKLLSVNKQTPTYSSDTIDADENSDLFTLDAVPVIFKLCAIFVCCLIHTLFTKCNPTSIRFTFLKHWKSATTAANLFLETVVNFRRGRARHASPFRHSPEFI